MQLATIILGIAVVLLGIAHILHLEKWHRRGDSFWPSPPRRDE